MPKQLTETAAISEKAAAAAKDTGVLPIQFISPGWGSSGYYSPQVLEQAAADNVIPAGTHMYADHPTDGEHFERPGRSIKDLMAVTVEDAKLSTDGALIGKVHVVPAWRDLLETVRDHIGVSIRASATDIVEGEAEGRRGGIIEGLVAPVMSVDFVTRAGRGGKVLQVLESADTNRRALDRGVEEATVNDTREALQTALRDAYATAKDTWLYVRDFDESTVWFEVEGSGDNAGIYGQPYDEDSGDVTLTGTRTEVRVQTTYVPVTRPDSNTPTTTESLEDNMAKIQIEETEHTRLTETAGRVDALESENVTLKTRADVAESKLATYERNEAARKVIAESASKANVAFTDREVKGFLADVVVKEDGTIDSEKFTALVDEEAAAKKVAEGAGSVSGYGGPVGIVAGTNGEQLTPQLVESAIGSAFGRTVKEA